MTGFARSEGSTHGQHWAWEARSVNARSIDVRPRVPNGFDAVEIEARRAAQALFKRGNITLQLTVSREASNPPLRVNREMLQQVIDAVRDLDADGIAAPRLDGLLGLRGVIEVAEEEDPQAAAALDQGVRRGLGEVLSALAAAREEEGARLAPVLTDQISSMRSLVAAARTTAASQPQAIKARLLSLVEPLLSRESGIAEDRLAQEVALIAAKADVTEEMDRLVAHLDQADALLQAAEAIGRRLDFLCQELNREANTLCSKSSDVELTRIGLDLKAVIDQFREQVQNVQ